MRPTSEGELHAHHFDAWRFVSRLCSGCGSAEAAAAAGKRRGGAGGGAVRRDGEAQSRGDNAISPDARVARFPRRGGIGGGARKGLRVERCGNSAISRRREDFLRDAKVAAGVGGGNRRALGG